jgi:hypothetical protein
MPGPPGSRRLIADLEDLSQRRLVNTGCLLLSEDEMCINLHQMVIKSVVPRVLEVLRTMFGQATMLPCSAICFVTDNTTRPFRLWFSPESFLHNSGSVRLRVPALTCGDRRVAPFQNVSHSRINIHVHLELGWSRNAGI